MLSTLGPSEVVVAVCAGLVLGAVGVERVAIRCRTGTWRWRSLGTAAAMLAGALVVGSALTPVLDALWTRLGSLAPAPLAALTASHPVVELVVVFVAWDLAGYGYHWIGHHTAMGWAAHRPHHTGVHYDLSLAWRQSWVPWPAVVTFPFVALTGGSIETAGVCAALSALWQAVVHTSAPVPLPGWLDRCVVTPRLHRRHHESTVPVNLGPVLTLWDRLAGTFAPGSDRGADDPLATAAPDADALAIQLAGWRALWTRKLRIP